MAVGGKDIICHWGQVFVPVNEEMKEFIEAGQDGRHGKSKTQNLERLVGILISSGRCVG